jgi:hypothetical protein
MGSAPGTRGHRRAQAGTGGHRRAGVYGHVGHGDKATRGRGRTGGAVGGVYSRAVAQGTDGAGCRGSRVEGTMRGGVSGVWWNDQAPNIPSPLARRHRGAMLSSVCNTESRARYSTVTQGHDACHRRPPVVWLGMGHSRPE